MVDSISKSYAQALMDLLKSNNISIESSINDLKEIKTIIDDKSINNFLLHPAIKTEEKEEIMKNSLKEFNDTIVSFILVLLNNKRINSLGDIISSIQAIDDEEKGVLRVKIISTSELSEGYYQKIIKVLEANYNKKIIGNMEIDPNLLGGIKVLINGSVIDDTLLNKLKSIKDTIVYGGK